jgi:transcriptional regulator with XRE-family HTH domain
MSAQDLADETTKLGLPLSRSQIANYESGRKHSLDLTELLIFAAALDIPPALLLFPTFPDDTVEVLPGRVVDTSRALDWLSGHATLAIGPSTPGTQLIEAAGRLASIEDDLVRMRGSMDELSMPPAVATSTKEVIRRMEERAAAYEEWIVTAKTALWGSVDE